MEKQSIYQRYSPAKGPLLSLLSRYSGIADTDTFSEKLSRAWGEEEPHSRRESTQAFSVLHRYYCIEAKKEGDVYAFEETDAIPKGCPGYCEAGRKMTTLMV